mmetsp:Transcript_113584/g.242468  ORF Transcript_113584/g.242468 Transcript_113584/m.242468 type:complete len:220 (-) Transcript_113584:104-763(-)
MRSHWQHLHLDRSISGDSALSPHTCNERNLMMRVKTYIFRKPTNSISGHNDCSVNLAKKPEGSMHSKGTSMILRSTSKVFDGLATPSSTSVGKEIPYATTTLTDWTKDIMMPTEMVCTPGTFLLLWKTPRQRQVTKKRLQRIADHFCPAMPRHFPQPPFSGKKASLQTAQPMPSEFIVHMPASLKSPPGRKAGRESFFSRPQVRSCGQSKTMRLISLSL